MLAGVFELLLPLAYWVVPEAVPDPPLMPQHQPAENLLYLLGFFVLLPVSLWTSLRLSDRMLAVNPARLPVLAAFISAGPLLVAGLTRLAYHLGVGGGLETLFVLALLWAVVGALLVFLFLRPGTVPVVDRLGTIDPTLALLGGVACLGVAVLGLSSFRQIDGPALAVGLVIAGLITWAWTRLKVRHLRRPWGVVLDLVVFLLVLLAVPDMVIYRTGEFSTGFDDGFGAYIQQFHGALFIGAVSQIQAGSTLLVNTVSQYGVASIYFLAAVFKFLPLGYGTLSLTDGVLSGFVFACGYSILRMSGVNRLLAAGSMAVAVFVLIYSTTYPIGGLLQHGAIRFGLLPISLITLRLAALRWPAGSRFTSLLAWFVVGLSAVWALESFLYTTATLAGLTLVAMTWQPRERWPRWVLGQAGRTLLAWLSVHLAFAIGTLIASGELPDWGMYFTYLRDFLSGDVGDLTYDFVTFSPGLLVGAGYATSALLLFATLLRNRDFSDRNRLALFAIGGLTAYGVALFSYFDNRSLAHILQYVSLPLLLSFVIWLNLALTRSDVGASVKTTLLASSFCLAALCVSIVWPAASDRAGDSMLAWALPGGHSVREGIDRLENLPPVVAGADEGARLIEKYMPDEDRTAIITVPDLDVNVLVLTGRSNRLGITDAKEDSWVSGPHEPVVDQAVDDLQAGDRMLVDSEAMTAFRELRRNPGADRDAITLQTSIASIQLRILARIGERFDLQPVARGSDGLEVVELVPRQD